MPEDILQAIEELALTEAYALLIAAVPFLGWPVIGVVTAFVLRWLGNLVFKAIQKFVAFKAIEWKTEAQNVAYQETVTSLKTAQASGDKDAISVAKTNFKKKLCELVHLDSADRV